MRFSDAIQNYRSHLELERSPATVQGYHGALMQFCLYMRNPLITQIYVEQVETYLREHLELGWSKNSLVAKSMAFRKFFEYYKRKGYLVLDWQALPIMHKQSVEPNVATPNAVELLLKHTEGEDIYDIRNKAIILLLADGGMRNSELCSLNVDVDTDTFSFDARCGRCQGDVSLSSKLSTMSSDMKQCRCGEHIQGHPTADTEKQFSAVLRTKKRRSGVVHRRVFWYSRANEALKAWIEKRGMFAKFFFMKHPEALFVGVKTWRAGYRMTPSTLALMLRTLSSAAEIPTVNAHSLRHMFGFEAAQQGMNNSNISDLMGHSTLESSLVYTHLRGESLALAHRRIKQPLEKKKEYAMVRRNDAPKDEEERFNSPSD